MEQILQQVEQILHKSGIDPKAPGTWHPIIATSDKGPYVDYVVHEDRLDKFQTLMEKNGLDFEIKEKRTSYVTVRVFEPVKYYSITKFDHGKRESVPVISRAESRQECKHVAQQLSCLRNPTGYEDRPTIYWVHDSNDTLLYHFEDGQTIASADD